MQGLSSLHVPLWAALIVESLVICYRSFIPAPATCAPADCSDLALQLDYVTTNITLFLQEYELIWNLSQGVNYSCEGDSVEDPGEAEALQVDFKEVSAFGWDQVGPAVIALAWAGFFRAVGAVARHFTLSSSSVHHGGGPSHHGGVP